MNDVVYVVTEGTYSDYHICGIFTTQENAEEYISVFFKDDRWSEYRIEEHDLNPYMAKFEEGLKPYFVRIDKEGKIDKVETTRFTDDQTHKVRFSSFNEYMIVYCWARDPEHAIKIAGERRTRVLAADAWGDNSRVNEIV